MIWYSSAAIAAGMSCFLAGIILITRSRSKAIARRRRTYTWGAVLLLAGLGVTLSAVLVPLTVYQADLLRKRQEHGAVSTPRTSPSAAP